jgi:hypothetical protein
MIRTIKITLITISMVLFSLSISSFIINVYAQTQGGAATSGPATGGAATSGPATGGAATSGGGNSTSHLISNSSSISNKSPFR